jgi:hypothetical protein
MIDPTDAEEVLISEVLQRFAKDVRRTLGPRWQELSLHAVCKLFAGLMVTESVPEMLGLANGYLAVVAETHDMSHAPQLHLVPVSDLASDDLKPN